MQKLRLNDMRLDEDGALLLSDPVVASEAGSGPFTARWCVVQPGAESHGHMHLEHEAFIVIRGRGEAVADDVVEDVESGDALIFAPFTRHTIRNPATSAEDLVFLTMYWVSRPDSDSEPRATVGSRRVLVFATPPTPNGDLHLGHMSGPYLAADIWRRHLRAKRVDVRYVTGTDDHQSYVEFKGHQLHQSAADTASQYAARIRKALVDADVVVDRFIQPGADPAHRDRTAALFRRLYETNKFIRERAPTLYCGGCNRYLFEVYVRGLCPHCGSRTAGNGCEECGRPNECVDLVDPTCAVCGRTPEIRPLERIVFPLEAYRERLREFVAGASMSTHLRTLCERMLEDRLPSVSVTHRSDWGIPVPVPGFEGQVIWSWVEIAGLYLGAAAELGTELDWPLADGAFLDEGAADVVQFFGYDNGYFKAILLTAVYLAYDAEAHLPPTFVTNEFYRLDSRKFSTSSNHLIGVSDFLQSVDSDFVRFYLSYTRPELEQTNFTREDFTATVQRELVDRWQNWLHDLGERLRRRFSGVVPDIGLWTDEHREFRRRLRACCLRIEESLTAPHVSPLRLTHLLSELVDEARQFGVAESHWTTVRTGRDMERTSMALELAAARALAIACAPVMPRFGARLWESLGYPATGDACAWDPIVDFVPAGVSINLEQPFFSATASWATSLSA
jgi:methionyl-tRNA synthetase